MKPFRILCYEQGRLRGHLRRGGRILEFQTLEEAQDKAARLNRLDESLPHRGRRLWQFEVIRKAKRVELVPQDGPDARRFEPTDGGTDARKADFR